MAQKEGNLEIRGFVHDLMVILSYNLGKEKAVSTLRTEVEIARKYIEIQNSGMILRLCWRWRKVSIWMNRPSVCFCSR
ncbi:MAG: histidine kinase [Blautia sp.]